MIIESNTFIFFMLSCEYFHKALALFIADLPRRLNKYMNRIYKTPLKKPVPPSDWFFQLGPYESCFIPY